MASDPFEGREKALEGKYARDEELHFRLEAKAVGMFGLWAASQLGYKDSEAQQYADQVTDVYVQQRGLADVFARVRKDFSARGIEVIGRHLENRFRMCRYEAMKAERILQEA